MRRPAPLSLSQIRHPGPKSADRHPFVLCNATPVKIDLPAGVQLQSFLGTWAEESGFASAILNFKSLRLKSFDYVMPDRAADDRHVAWYSETRRSAGAHLDDSVAVLGRRDGNWFAHVHAYWSEQGANHLGHLLPHTIETSDPSQITGWGLKGAMFEAAEDPETEFTLFRVKEHPETFTQEPVNALIATLAPFEDLSAGVEKLADKLKARQYGVHGLGSLAGTEFLDSSPMTGLISEILLLPEAGCHDDNQLSLPVRCVDLEGNLFRGTVKPNTAPTLVTCELLITKLD